MLTWFSLATQAQGKAEAQAKMQAIGMTQVKTKFDANNQKQINNYLNLPLFWKTLFSLAKHNYVW